MNTTTTNELARLKNHSTRYELAATHPDGRRVLISYTPRNNRRGMIDATNGKAERIVKLCEVTHATYSGRGEPPHMICGEWRIAFTGRTQREAVIAGELPFIGDLIPEPNPNA